MPKGKRHPTFLPSGYSVERPGETGAIHMSLDNLPDFLTVQEVAGLLRVRVQTVRKWCSEGWLSYHKLNVGAGKGSAVRIHRSVMLDLLQRGYVPEKNDI
jgi:excisionase family DNA binding protein